MVSLPAAASPVRSGPSPARTALSTVDILAGAAWIAVCATGPEFIWRGARLVGAHLDWTELLTAIPLGLLLAFFVEPLLERVRHLLIGPSSGHSPHAAPDTGDEPVIRRRGAAFHALSGLSFAFCAICVHDAMKALALSHGVRHASAAEGTAPAIALSLGWALTPFAVALAWRAAQRPVLCWVLCALAVGAPVLAGDLFGWSRADILDTLVPCIAILLVGLRRLRAGVPFAEAALGSVAQIAVAWLLFALLLDLVLDATGCKRYALYSPGGFRMDVRFYAGWLAGLWLVPSHGGVAMPFRPVPATPRPDPVLRQPPHAPHAEQA